MAYGDTIPLPDDYCPQLLTTLRELRPDCEWSLYGLEYETPRHGRPPKIGHKPYVQAMRNGVVIMDMSIDKMVNALFFYRWMKEDRMDKPQPKREIAIASTHRASRLIRVHASRDAAEDIAEFGNIYQPFHGGDDTYDLHVDARYDFDEVVAYIEGYGKTTEGDTE